MKTLLKTINAFLPGGGMVWLCGVALAVGLFAGWTVRSWRADSEMLDVAAAQNKIWADEMEKLEKKSRADNERSRQLEIALAKFRSERKRADVQDPVFRDCALPVVSVQSLNLSIEAANNARASR